MARPKVIHGPQSAAVSSGDTWLARALGSACGALGRRVVAGRLCFTNERETLAEVGAFGLLVGARRRLINLGTPTVVAFLIKIS